jgi:hypothetical protein
MSAEKIRELNDKLRTNLIGGKVMMTRSVSALPPDRLAQVLTKMRNFSDFSEDNDPHSEHDMAFFDHEGTSYAFKIDYYDPAMAYGSEDPADPARTTRVLTLMLAEDY